MHAPPSAESSPKIAFLGSNQQHQGIKLPPILQALREEIRVLDRYVRDGRLTTGEAAQRLDEWGITYYPPGMHYYDELALSRQPREVPPTPTQTKHRTAQSTVDAFFGWIVRQDEATQERWLAEHPEDATYIKKLWEAKCKPQSK
jgi:hypothetical protein